MVGSKNLKPSTTPFFPNQFLKNQFRTSPNWPPKNTNLSGRTAIITGGNTGLGYECSLQLLGLKLSHLIITVRSEAKGKAAAATLSQAFPKSTIDVWLLDMNSYDSIRAFAQRVDEQLSRLDFAILNAGLRNLKYNTNPATGHEEVIQVNYLSTALLSILLLPSLKTKSPSGTPGRLTIVGAALALVAPLPPAVPILPSFDNPKEFRAEPRYCSSKLLGQMFLWKLSDYVSDIDVVVNIADPGFVKGTELGRGLSGGARIGYKAFGAIAGRAISIGASTYVDGAVLKGEESHGGFLMGWEVQPFNSSLYTPAGSKAIDQLWDETIEELSFAGVRGVLESLK